MAEPQRYSYQGRAKVFAWYELEESDVFECRCGWSGPAATCSRGYFHDLVDGSCPKCDTMLFVRGFPTFEETRQAAARGLDEAIAELPHVAAMEARSARASEVELRPDSPLPELEGDHLDFVWDFEEVDGERWTLIRSGDQTVWRELAYWEGQDRFIAVRNLLRQRFGPRFRTLTPSKSSELYLYGDERPRI